MAGEFELIKRYLAAPASCRTRRQDGYAEIASGATGVVLGPGDDATLLAPTPQQQLVISVDTSVVDVHFPSEAPPHAIGHRALAVSLSDLAAMGARARWYLLALTLPRVEDEWVAEMARGMHELAAQYGVTLVGGDTTRGQLALSLTVHGEVDPARVIRRDGARVGDQILVVGHVGGGAAGLRAWQEGERSLTPLLAAYLYPRPLLAEGYALAEYATAGMDISDGVLADLMHLCAASGVGAVLDIGALPLHPAARDAYGREASTGMALSGGDDYALLLTLPPEALPAAERALYATGQPLTVIGHIAKRGVFETAEGRPLSATGWQHFY